MSTNNPSVESIAATRGDLVSMTGQLGIFKYNYRDYDKTMSVVYWITDESERAERTIYLRVWSRGYKAWKWIHP